MKFRSISLVLLAGLCLIVFSAISISDDAVRLRAPRLRIMSHVLEKAECPLTDAQVEQIKELERGPELFNVLKQNYPNPFNPTTTIDYQIARPGNVTIEIYSPGGQLVSTLVNEYKAAGQHSVVWDASSHAAGVYIYKITSGDFSQTQKMTLLK